MEDEDPITRPRNGYLDYTDRLPLTFDFDDYERASHHVQSSNQWRRDSRCIHKKGIFIFCLLLLSVIAVTTVYYRSENAIFEYYKIPVEKIRNKPENIIIFDELIQDNFEFDISGQDVMVFLHMQKTGGTSFGKHLVQDLDLERDCECHKGHYPDGKKKKLRCNCFRPGKGNKNWLFSRYSTGWKCGLHSDWTELTNCVDTYLKGIEPGEKTRRYFYITILRDPISRYLSEFRHVKRGATWAKATHMCGGKAWGNILPKCYQGDDWMDVSLAEFLNCPSNMASNRQTRMLADLELVGCYNKSSSLTPEHRNRILLESAKSNLEKMAFFGLTEDQRVSQYLFEETFNLEFRTVFDQYNITESGNFMEEMDAGMLSKVKSKNLMDIELYAFAKKLLKTRFNKMKAMDTKYEHHIGRLNADNKLQFSWQTIEDEQEIEAM